MPPPVIPHLDTAEQRARAESMLATAYRSGITDPRELSNFMGQVQHESQNFTRLQENLNYSVDGLLDNFSRYRISAADAQQYGRSPGHPADQTAIANTIYGGEWGRTNLGNTEAGDGYQFRGRGYIQMTGRDNYTAYGRSSGLDLVNHPELAAQPGNAERLAVGYWQTAVQPNAQARTSVTEAGSIINTGEPGNTPKGLTERQAASTAWENALKTDYLQDVLNRHPQMQQTGASQTADPAPGLRMDSQLSPQSLQLIEDSQRHVRDIAQRHQLPWDRGMDNTVHAVARQAREDGLTGITHMKVADNQIRYAQHDGLMLRDGSMDARTAANTEVSHSVSRMAETDQQRHTGAHAFTQPEPTREMEAPAMSR